MPKLCVDVLHAKYDIVLENGCLNNLKHYFDTERHIFILCDENIPEALVNKIKAQLSDCFVYRVKPGEGAKSLKVYEEVEKALLAFKMSRKDLLIALGGGVIGDLGGFVAATYMRGIDFIAFPTTTLAQIDSSIGGKVALNLGEVKNIIGNFYHPKLVLIDFTTLQTLPHRQVINGLVEAIKAGLIHDPTIFEMFEDGWEKHLEAIIYRSLLMKKWVVEADECEHGIRKTLNFGHTIGHGIEAYYHLDKYYHGECVAMGMLYFIEDEQLKQRVLRLYEKMGIMAQAPIDIDQVYDTICVDKKVYGNKISVCKVKEIGKAYIEEIDKSDLKVILERGI